MIMKLYESLQQLFRQYGHGILEEESIVTKLTGLRAFDGSPALRDAMKCLSENGCLKELLIRSRRNIASDFALYTGYLRKSLEESWHFDHDTALLAVDSLSFALGHTASEPGTAPAAPAPGGESAGESPAAPDTAISTPPEAPAAAVPDAPEEEPCPPEECPREAAEAGDAEAQLRLASMYYRGEGVEQDYREAAKWYRKAAEQGHAEAEYRLGETYFWRQGVEQSPAKAALWYRRAAEHGSGAAQCALAEMYYYSRGRRSIAKAAYWYRKAADNGQRLTLDADEKFRFGEMYCYGGEVEQDYGKAFRWYREAAEDGHAFAPFRLGTMYDKGQGVRQDTQRALEWYQKAA